MKNNIASERKRMGLSQADLADEFHTTRDIIKNFENGTTPIKSNMLEDLADYFGCSIDYLMGRCDDRVSHLRMVG